MDKPVLNDENVYPDDHVLREHLGPAADAWGALATLLAEEKPDYTTEWRYYKDGGSWLCKVLRKKKTICWLSVWDGYFKTGFYFGEKAEPKIVDSDLATEFKDQYLHGKRYGKIRAITVDVHQPADLDTTRILMGIREEV